MRSGFGEEHPYCDAGQNFFILLFIVTWATDTFWLNVSTYLMDYFHWLIRVSLTLIFVTLGIYLGREAHKMVFEEASSSPQVIEQGVFSYVRHPLYLGVLLTMIGLFFWSFSLFTLCVWLGLFIFYNHMATFEEEDLTRILGEKYKKYQRRVGKWFPKVI